MVRMQEVRTRALVLRGFDYGESDRLVHLYTEHLGRVSAIAKGAKRSRRRFPGTLEILTVADVRLVDPPRASILRLEAARAVEPFEKLTQDLGRFAIACHLCELLDRLTGEREAHPELFRFAVGALGTLREEQPDRLLALLVLAKTLAWLGYRPQLERCGVCETSILETAGGVAFDPRHGGAVCARCAPGEATWPARVLLALERGVRTPLRQRAALGLRGAEVRSAERLIQRFFQFHIGVELRSAAFLAEALDSGERSLDAPGDPGNTSRRSAEPSPDPPAAHPGQATDRTPEELASPDGGAANPSRSPGGVSAGASPDEAPLRSP
jgi:DNA repair protein RecO (recombination protein O)